MKRFLAFLKTELKLSLRDMNMPIFAVIMPLAIFIILGMIYGKKPAFDGARERRILKRLRVTPASPALLLGVELAVYCIYCVVSLAVLAVPAMLFWGVRLCGSLPGFLVSWAVTMISTLSIGMLVGGVAKDTKQASVIASILYFPMLVFSGTTLPIEVMPRAMQRVMSYFPLTQGISLMKSEFLGVGTVYPALPLCIMLCLTALCTGLAIRFFRWE